MTRRTRMKRSSAWLDRARQMDPGVVEDILGQRRFYTDPPARLKPAAVLIALSGDGVETGEVLLTHRSPSMRSHSGQIAFPGGRLDPGETPVQAALREAREETGLEEAETTVLSAWDTVTIRASGHPVTPVLAHWHAPRQLEVTSPAEADDVFAAPLVELLDPAQRLQVGFRGWQGPAFWHRDYLIWGFTGGLLAALFRHTGWEIPWRRHEVHGLQDVLARSRNNER
ncbi:CoA pyrophosphatase [Corynebacterium lizhenjunii]|uniref:CoA pyrophosphatase n=2 Tax=Corynebacterium lizhenjunii TaxID=2709394 RepID=A0A7T0KFD4_9CORY|nr:CoA pyrophosphatase [Corynebacterium lizhenjunii]